MFDIVRFDIDILPISLENKRKLIDEEFQTKSFESMLFTYVIKNDELFIDPCVSIANDKGFTKLENTEHRVFYNGNIIFYALTDDKEWFEFKANFIDGCLVYIERIFDDEPDIKINWAGFDPGIFLK